MPASSDTSNEFPAPELSTSPASAWSTVGSAPAELFDPFTSLSVSGAAEACDKHQDTIRRDLAADAYPGAVMVDGVYRIPVMDLVNAKRLPLDRVATATRNVAAKMSAMQAQALEIEVAELRVQVLCQQDLIAHQEVHIATLSALAARDAS